jgi:hypothetical protein
LKRSILILMLLINVIYIASYLINFDSFTLNKIWIFFFLISLCLSILFLFGSKKQSVLSIAALVASISSLGAYGFQYFISNLLG